MNQLCPIEPELLDALQSGFVPAELRHHIESCDSCRELELVAGSLLEDRSIAMAEAHVPAAGTMWWRLQLRRRHDAESRTRWTLVFGQALTVVVAIGLVVALLGNRILPEIQSLTEGFAVTRSLLVTIIVAAVALLAAPVAGWMALHRK